MYRPSEHRPHGTTDQTHEETDGYNPGLDFNAENDPPYALAGYDQINGIFQPTNFTLGEDWSITCQAFCQANLQGDASVAVTRTFTVIS